MICLRYLRYIKEEPRIYETFLNSTHIKGRSTGQTIGKIILEILENNGINVGGHPLSTYAKFSGKLTLLIPWYAHVRVLIRGLEMLVFRRIYVYVLNGCPLADYAPLHKHMMVPKLWTVKFHVQLLSLKNNNLLQNILIVVVMLSIFLKVLPNRQQYFELLINFHGEKLQLHETKRRYIIGLSKTK